MDIEKISALAEDVLSAIDENKGVDPRVVIDERMNLLEESENLTLEEINAIRHVISID